MIHKGRRERKEKEIKESGEGNLFSDEFWTQKSLLSYFRWIKKVKRVVHNVKSKFCVKYKYNVG